MPTNIKSNKKIQKTGVTLVETVVYVTLLAMLTTVTVTSLVLLNKSLQGIILGRIVNDTAQEVMEKITREIRVANSVDTLESSLGINPSILVLHSTDTAGDAVEIKFEILASTLEFYRDGSLVGPLTPRQVTIDELIFDHIITPESEAVKVSLVLQAQKGSTNIEETFSTTVLLRGSY